MAHQFVDFNVRDRKTAEQVIEEAAKMLKFAHNSLIKMQRGKSAMSEDFTKWFGTRTSARLKTVTDIVGIMDFGLNSGRIVWTGSHPDCSVNTNAAADPPQSGWSLKTIKDSLQAGDFQIGLCNRFFTALPANSDIHQSRVGTLIHELSHILGDTIDVAVDHISGALPRGSVSNQKTMYGAPSALWLANNHPDWAVQNAENYGFFCTAAFLEPSDFSIPDWIGA